jgi:hypothetical protein
MVVGNTSKYVEGFESFTLDDEMMLANLKQAVNYTKANMAISDVEMKLTNTTPTIKNSPPIKPQGRTINSDIPMPTNSKNNTVIRNSPTIPITDTSSKNTTTTKPNTISTKTDNSDDMNTMPDETDAMEDDMDDMDDMSDEPDDMPVNTMSNTMPVNTMSNTMPANTMPANTMPADMTDAMDGEDSDEGFQGSQQIESQTLRKMLLSLLITFLGYMLILSFTNNLIPISTYAPHLKPFKHFIYGGLFFLIVYLCLEVF